MAGQASMAAKAEAAVRDARTRGVVLDYSAGSAAAVEELISDLEIVARTTLDLDRGAWVGEHIGPLLDVAALGAYYGALFVRHAGATWGEADGEDGPEPAVIRGRVTVLPLTVVRRRVYDGPPLNLASYFREVQAAMLAEAGAT